MGVLHGIDVILDQGERDDEEVPRKLAALHPCHHRARRLHLVADGILESYRFEYRDGVNVIRREPFGVCALIAAWNWPSQLVTSKVAPALAAGCTVVLKPSELAPLTAVIITEILDAAGVPPGVLKVNKVPSRSATARVPSR